MKKCPEDKEFFEREYVQLGKSTNQIEKEFGYSAATIWRRLKKFGLNRNISKAVSGKMNCMWKGDNVGYLSLHEWIRNNKIKPEFCEDCKKSKPYDLANISGNYERDVNDFKWLCRSCHMKMDYKLGRRIPKGGKN